MGEDRNPGPGSRRRVFAGVVIAAAALDLWSKAAAFSSLGSPSPWAHREIVPRFLRFETAWNTGIAWSLFSESGSRWFIVAIGLVALPVIIGLFWRTKAPSWMFTLGMASIAGGTVGNIHDRIAYGAVRDFIRVTFIDFPIFNVADSFICVGAALCLLDALLAPKSDGAAEA